MASASSLQVQPGMEQAEADLNRIGWTEEFSGCWEWSGAVGKQNGYGYVRHMGKAATTHRLAYKAWVGPIPEGHVIRHKCDNRPCINPAHLTTGTHADNMRDAYDRGRLNWGDERPNSVLRNEDIPVIRSLISEGLTNRQIGDRFSVTRHVINQIRVGKSWKRY